MRVVASGGNSWAADLCQAETLVCVQATPLYFRNTYAAGIEAERIDLRPRVACDSIPRRCTLVKGSRGMRKSCNAFPSADSQIKENQAIKPAQRLQKDSMNLRLQAKNLM